MGPSSRSCVMELTVRGGGAYIPDVLIAGTTAMRTIIRPGARSAG